MYLWMHIRVVVVVVEIGDNSKSRSGWLVYYYDLLTCRMNGGGRSTNDGNIHRSLSITCQRCSEKQKKKKTNHKEQIDNSTLQIGLTLERCGPRTTHVL